MRQEKQTRTPRKQGLSWRLADQAALEYDSYDQWVTVSKKVSICALQVSGSRPSRGVGVGDSESLCGQAQAVTASTFVTSR